MSKKTIIGSLLVAAMFADEYKMWNGSMLKEKQLEGSAIYIPKRHKLKKKYKR